MSHIHPFSFSLHANVSGANLAELLFQRDGGYEPWALLMEVGALTLEQHLRWRNGNIDVLEPLLAMPTPLILRLLREADDWARQLGLGVELVSRVTSKKSGDLCRALQQGKARDEELFFTCYGARQIETGQLDLFLDAGATPIINDLRHRFLDHNIGTVTVLCARLRKDYPRHPSLANIEILCAALTDSFDVCIEPCERLTVLIEQITPAATQFFGHRAREFLGPFWLKLLPHFAGADFDAHKPHAHASWLHEQLGDWPGVFAATEPDRFDLYNEPSLLARRALALYKMRRTADANVMWCQLCWLDDECANELFQSADFPDGTLQSVWHDFLDLDSDLGGEPAWFPTWLLCVQPGLRFAFDATPILRNPEGRAQLAFAILHALITSEKASPNSVSAELRATLKQHAPEILHWYLSKI